MHRRASELGNLCLIYCELQHITGLVFLSPKRGNLSQQLKRKAMATCQNRLLYSKSGKINPFCLTDFVGENRNA